MVRRRSVIQSIVATRWAARYNPPDAGCPISKTETFRTVAAKFARPAHLNNLAATGLNGQTRRSAGLSEI